MSTILPAEFEKHSCVQVIFPHFRSDWVEYLDEASDTFAAIITAIAEFERCVVVCDDIERVRGFVDGINIEFIEYLCDDTWARDCSVIGVIEDSKVVHKDFIFNGWGSKFDASRDNLMSRSISSHYNRPLVSVDMVLEGGAIESSGDGVLLTTTACLLNANRNPDLNREQIEQKLQDELGIKKILWLTSGYLVGDDTDSHIDTLARFCSPTDICYVKCYDIDDEHFEELEKMEAELKEFVNLDNNHYRLTPLPLPEPIYYNGKRLPATYANFLILNSAVLVPTYNLKSDQVALKIVAELFRSREVVPIDCTTLIRQHGSLHCVTMQIIE